MLRDMEGNRLYITDKPNGHVLILGGSGYGKTYFICRRIEEKIKEGKSLLIFDYSGSYTESEMQKNQFQWQEKLRVLNPCNKGFVWEFCGDGLENVLMSAMLKAVEIGSYIQRKILQKAIGASFQEHGEFSFSGLLNQLEDFFNRDKEREMRENAGRLLTRISPVFASDEIRIKGGKSPSYESGVTVIQLSDYQEITRRFLTEFLTEITWEEVRNGNKRADIIIFDEFQNLSMKSQGAFASILREGRKFGLSAYFSSQFASGLDKEKEDTLMQSGHIFFFRPTIKDLRSTAELIDCEHTEEWKKILENLRIGEAVIRGNYRVNQGGKLCERPVICKIGADEPSVCEIDKNGCIENKGAKNCGAYNSQENIKEFFWDNFKRFEADVFSYSSKK